jgi:hypothetical protein
MRPTECVDVVLAAHASARIVAPPLPVVGDPQDSVVEPVCSLRSGPGRGVVVRLRVGRVEAVRMSRTGFHERILWRVGFPASMFGMVLGLMLIIVLRQPVGYVVAAASVTVNAASASMQRRRAMVQHPRMWGDDRVMVYQVDRHAAEAWRAGNDPGLVTIAEPAGA